MEIWKVILNGFYEVSSKGRLRRLAPVTGPQSKPGRILKGSVNGDGHIQVCLRMGNIKSWKLIHLLVAEAFLGPCPQGKEVKHIDSNYLNNEAANLKYEVWCSFKVLAPHRTKKEIREYSRAYSISLRRDDPLYKVKCYLRTQLCKTLKAKSFKKTSHFFTYIGCTLEELKIHIEKQFTIGMTWNNHCEKGWHVDHIKALGNATTVEELIKLCHYTNLQPLWWDINISKGDK